MEPRIHYCRTSDGVSIAFTREGSGAPFVMSPNLWTNIDFFYRLVPQMLEANAARGLETFLLDGRGTGASQRDVSEVSLDTRLRDLEAVADHLGLQSMVLMGVSHGGPTAIAYAARHPERVARLILANTYANGAQYYRLAPVMRALAAIEDMASDQWEFYTRTAANAVLGYGQPERAEEMAELYRDSITSEMLVRYREASRETDVTSLLGEVRCPALVIDDKYSPLRVEELSRQLASGIPGARLVSFGAEPMFLWGSEAMVEALDDFLGMETRAATPAPPSRATHTSMIAILFLDIVGSTDLTERLGDTAYRARGRSLDERLRAIIRKHAGTPIDGKVLGDGVLASFPAAAQGIAAAQACNDAAEAAQLQLHMGLHVGDVIHEDNNVFGGAVNIASRISALSAPGELLVSDVVRSLARTSAGVTFEDRGEHALKGIDEPQRVFAVRPQ